MSLPLDVARDTLFAPAELNDGALGDVLGSLMLRDVDYADLYFQDIRSESWMLEDGRVRTGASQVDRGVGVRAVSGDKSGFAYADDLRLPALTNAARAARAIVRQGQGGTVAAQPTPGVPRRYAPLDPSSSLPVDEQLALMRRADAAARAADPRVSQVSVTLASSRQVVAVMASDGRLAADVRPIVRLGVSVVLEDGDRREQGNAGGGARVDYRWFDVDDKPEAYAREAVRLAAVQFDAVAAPAGVMPVVLGSGWPGILLHEAVGHGLEGDFNRKGSSAFSGRIGQQVAARGVTVVDDGTLPDRRGSLTVDDEGTPSHCTTLIEDGVLVGYMQDRMNARLMGAEPTGNARRESYAHLPMPRMTNTYMRAGTAIPEEIIASVDKGIYAVNFNGGQVDITSGNFVFSASEAYLIENGKVTRPVKGATLIGNGPEAIKQISMIGNDLQLDPGVGVCGKDGQSVPVGVGQPTLKLDALTVGGTQA